MSDIHTIRWFIDSASGTTKGLQWNAEAPQICSQDYKEAIAEGDLTGHTPWLKAGFLSGTSANVWTDVWSRGGIYAFPSTAGYQMSVASSSSIDSATGAGTQQVRIGYLDSAYAEQSEVLTLAGTTTVNTVATNIARIQNFRCYITGSSGCADGNIFLSIATGSTVYGRISPLMTKARTMVWTVPANKTLYVTSIAFSVVSGSKQAMVRFVTRATYDDASARALTEGIFFMPYHEVVLQDNSFFRILEVPTKLPARTDLKVSALSDQAGAMCTTILRGWTE
jgi:hypothetical protein